MVRFADVFICLVKNVLHSFATNTMFVGEISNFILGCAFVVPGRYLSIKKKSDKKGAVIASVSGTVAMSAFKHCVKLFLRISYLL